MLFDFPTMQAMYLSLAREDAGPLRSALMGRPQSPSDSQWAVFARNHDELTLDKLSGAERAEVFASFGPEEDMQVYGRGLRRRLPPMLDNDPARIRLVYSLMMSLPGTPTLFYGEEIGMGENLDLDGRMAVRTPMQWHPGKVGGFSTADPEQLCRPFPAAPYGPDQVNVVSQRHDPDSLFSFLREHIRCYRECPELGWGTLAILDHDRDSRFWSTRPIGMAELCCSVTISAPTRSPSICRFPNRQANVASTCSIGRRLFPSARRAS